MSKLRVLYLDGAGPFGGAARSLFELVRGLVTSCDVEAYVVMQRGSAMEYYQQVAKDIVAVPGLTRVDNTQYSYYRGTRWLVLLREAYHLPFTVFAIFAARLRWGRVDLIHANEIVDIVPALLAHMVFRAPLVVHVRSLQRPVSNSLRARWLARCLQWANATVVAIDNTVAATLPLGLRASIIHNAFTPQQRSRPDNSLLLQLGCLRAGALKVGFVGNLHVSKGILELVEAVRLLIESGRDVECVVAGGETRNDRGLVRALLLRLGLAQNVRAQVTRSVAEYGISHSFHLLGHVDDIASVYKAMDVVAFPSHFNAPGRPVLEAALFGVPSIVCVARPQPDTLVDGETGVAIPARDPRALADAIAAFCDRPTEVRRMGDNARTLVAAHCDPAVNARRMRTLYDSVVGKAMHRADPVSAGPLS